MVSQKQVQVRPRWTRSDVLVLLCALNFNCHTIRKEFEADRKAGIIFATELLSKAVGPHCNPTRVKTKLKTLWAAWAEDDAENKGDDLYKHGACPRTLPRLDHEYPGMLAELAAKSLKADLESISKKQTKLDPENRELRRSKRRRKADEDNDPIICLCGFGHYGGSCIHCDICPSWQHLYCYYSTEEIKEAPDDHLCDKCQLISANTCLVTKGSELDDLSTAFQQLELAVKKHTLGVAECEEDVLWGPGENDISNTVGLIGQQIRRVANSICPLNSSFEDIFSGFLEKSDELATLLQQCFIVKLDNNGKQLPTKAEPPTARSVDILKALTTVAVTEWVFYPTLPAVLSLKDLLFEAYQREIISNDSFKLLKSLHRMAWTSLFEKDPKRLAFILGNQAEDLACRLVAALEPLSVYTKAVRPKHVSENWLVARKSGPELYKIIVQIFHVSLKLKASLPSTGYYYEVFVPEPGAAFQTSFMTTETGELLPSENFIVQVCVISGVIAYSVDIFQSSEKTAEDLFGPQRFIKASEAERLLGRVVRPAIVRTFEVGRV
ncbi:hypothetical protein MMC13_003492 [Lambiella insularis]|nr:hypothetical protein [Lambiella insularis]